MVRKRSSGISYCRAKNCLEEPCLTLETPDKDDCDFRTSYVKEDWDAVRDPLLQVQITP